MTDDEWRWAVWARGTFGPLTIEQLRELYATLNRSGFAAYVRQAETMLGLPHPDDYIRYQTTAAEFWEWRPSAIDVSLSQWIPLIVQIDHTGMHVSSIGSGRTYSEYGALTAAWDECRRLHEAEAARRRA